MAALPEHASRVYKGTIYEIWQWEQMLYDGSTVLYECAKRNDSVTVIPLVGDKILIEYQEFPTRDGEFVSLPGGFCDTPDTPLHDAQRELLEETGYSSEQWELFFTWSPPGQKLIWSNHFYSARDCKKKHEQKLDAGEKIRCELITFDEFLALADHPHFRHKDLEPLLLRARYDTLKKDELYKKLFG